jgi:transposase
MFSAWIHDVIQPFAVRVEVGNPGLMKAIWAGKNKNDELNAEQIADLVRANLMPRVYVPKPELRQLRDVLRFRSGLVGDRTQRKNRMSGLLLPYGAEFERSRWQRKTYLGELQQQGSQWVPEAVPELLECGRRQVETLKEMDARLVSKLQWAPAIAGRVAHLKKIEGVGEITALTWVLEIGDIPRIPSIGKAISYCGLCSADRGSAGKQLRGPISKQRNAHRQTVLIEAAHWAPRWNAKLQAGHEQERQKAGADNNQATISVARKLGAYLLAADRQYHRQSLSAQPSPTACGEQGSVRSD